MSSNSISISYDPDTSPKNMKKVEKEVRENSVELSNKIYNKEITGTKETPYILYYKGDYDLIEDPEKAMELGINKYGKGCGFVIRRIAGAVF